VNTTGWLKGLEVTADGTGIVSHAGVALLRALSDKTGLTAGLSKALASRRLLVHDRGRVLADLACAIAGGAEVISDFRVMADQGGLFGPVASVPTCWRALNEIAAGGQRAAARVTGAVNAERRHGRRRRFRHGAPPGVQVADKTLKAICIRLDATGAPSRTPVPPQVAGGGISGRRGECVSWACRCFQGGAAVRMLAPSFQGRKVACRIGLRVLPEGRRRCGRLRALGGSCFQEECLRAFEVSGGSRLTAR
jgi:hypothetical protein